MAKAIDRRLRDLEQATGNTDLKIIAVFQQPAGGWELGNGVQVSEETIARMAAAHPNTLIIRVIEDPNFGFEADDHEDDI